MRQPVSKTSVGERSGFVEPAGSKGRSVPAAGELMEEPEGFAIKGVKGIEVGL